MKSSKLELCMIKICTNTHYGTSLNFLFSSLPFLPLPSPHLLSTHDSQSETALCIMYSIPLASHYFLLSFHFPLLPLTLLFSRLSFTLSLSLSLTFPCSHFTSRHQACKPCKMLLFLLSNSATKSGKHFQLVRQHCWKKDTASS